MYKLFPIFDVRPIKSLGNLGKLDILVYLWVFFIYNIVWEHVYSRKNFVKQASY